MGASGEHQYVTWGDAVDALRYVEQGYGVKLTIRMWQDCPKGEQYPRLNVRVVPTNDEGVEYIFPSRVERAFPSKQHRTLPAMLLWMVYEMDNQLAETREWNEPLSSPARGWRDARRDT